MVIFPVITASATGAERRQFYHDGYPDVALEMIDDRTFDGRIQLVEYQPRVLDHPPLNPTSHDVATTQFKGKVHRRGFHNGRCGSFAVTPLVKPQRRFFASDFGDTDLPRNGGPAQMCALRRVQTAPRTGD